MRVLVVSRQRTVAKTQTEIHEGRRDEAQRVPAGVPGNSYQNGQLLFTTSLGLESPIL